MINLIKPTKQSSNEEVNDNKDVEVSIVKGKKIIITTISAIFADGKLSTTSTKIALPEDEQDVRVKKIWIETSS